MVLIHSHIPFQPTLLLAWGATHEVDGKKIRSKGGIRDFICLCKNH